METRPCRITGLSSTKGQRLNGTAAVAPAAALHARSDKRFDVAIEGQPKPLSLKRSSFEFFPSNIFDGGIGVGRSTIRDVECISTAADNLRGSIVSPRQKIRGEGCRCLGNLLAVLSHLKMFNARNEKGICIMCTDLNISRAVDN